MKKKWTKTEVKLYIKNILLVLLGTFILAFGTEIFLAQSKLVTGGMSGIAIVLDEIIPWDFLSFNVIMTILTFAFFALGWIFLGRDFAIKTFVSAISYPGFLFLCSILINPNINLFNGFFINWQTNYEPIKEVISSIFGGALVGAGCAISFIGGGSTGGTDVIAFIFCKVFKKVKESTMVFFTDAFVVLMAVFVLKDLVLSLLGIISAFICALVIDKLFLGESQAFLAQIVTTKHKEISQMVIDKLDRTTTIVDCVGGYSEEDKKLVIVLFTMKEYNVLTTEIKKIDPNVFMAINRAHEIKGEGWN